MIDEYRYDVLGQRIVHWNNLFGSGDAETSDYDVQGRVISARAFGGDVTRTVYGWSGGLGASGLGTNYGGTTQVTTYANGRTIGDEADAFGHATAHTDLGGRVTTFGYDRAGRLVERSGTGTDATQRYTYLNIGLAATVSSGTVSGGVFTERARASYGYDAVGRKTSEYAVDYTLGGQAIENASVRYDALGRMVQWSDAGGVATNGASKTWVYDAVGNVRRLVASYAALDPYGSVSGPGAVDAWYLYDAMNRVTTSQGILSGGRIVRGTTGTDLLYDAAGQRVAATRAAVLTAYHVYDPNYTPPGGGGPRLPPPIYPGDADGPAHYHDVSYQGARQ